VSDQWGVYLQGDPWAFRSRLKLRNGLSLADAVAIDPWERDVFDAIDAPGARLTYLDSNRGSGKSTIASGVSVERCALRPEHDVLLLANDADQASLLHREAAGFVARDPLLSRLLEVRVRSIENPQNGSRIVVLTSDSISNYGFGARWFTAIADEFWGWPNRDLFDALWTAVPKSPGSQVIILTNAGPTRDGIAWEVRELCRTSGDPALKFWSAAEHNVRPSWIDVEEVERQRCTLPHSVFARLWLGEWGMGEGTFLTREIVESCIDSTLDPHALAFSTRWRSYVGIDLGLKHDRSVVALGHREREVFVVDHLQSWSGTPEHPVDLESVQAYLSMLARKVRITRAYADPWNAHMLIERAKRAGLRNIEEYVFTGAHLMELSSTLYTAFRSRLVRIPAYQPLIDELVALRVIDRGRWWRIDHASGGHSDFAMALGLAIVAALPERGEPLAADRQFDDLLARYVDRLPSHDRKLFGFPHRRGLALVEMEGERGEDFESAIRCAQILRRIDRISAPEFESIRRELAGRVHAHPTALHQLPCIDGGWLDAELGA